MPDTTDPANARLALRRLVSGLLQANPERRIDGDASIDDLLGVLDSDELADYEQVLDALRVATPPRFARHGREVLDLRRVYDPHAGDVAAHYVFDASEVDVASAVVRLLNADPEAWDRAVAAGEEPF